MFAQENIFLQKMTAIKPVCVQKVQRYWWNNDRFCVYIN